jgi:hypothetical protein
LRGSVATLCPAFFVSGCVRGVRDAVSKGSAWVPFQGGDGRGW